MPGGVDDAITKLSMILNVNSFLSTLSFLIFVRQLSLYCLVDEL